jgi:hypothetical protein
MKQADASRKTRTGRLQFPRIVLNLPVANKLKPHPISRWSSVRYSRVRRLTVTFSTDEARTQMSEFSMKMALQFHESVTAAPNNRLAL